MNTVTKNYLHPLFLGEAIILDATDGIKTIAHAVDVFHYIDRSFGGYWDGLGMSSQKTQPTLVKIHEVVRDGNFRNFFGSKSSDWGWVESQVVSFCCVHRSLLHNEQHATLFPLRGGFVARVDFDVHGRLGVYAYRTNNDRIWHAKFRHRVITPGEVL